MMQLVGYHAWRAGADRDNDQEAASVGIKRARAEMITQIRDLTYRELSEVILVLLMQCSLMKNRAVLALFSKWDVAQIMSHSIAGGF